MAGSLGQRVRRLTATSVGASDAGRAGPASRPGTALLDVSDLRVQFRSRGRVVNAVQGVSFTVEPGRTLAIIGESGSGKTVSAYAVLGLLPRTAQVSGSIRFDGFELVGCREKDLRDHRGRNAAMVFQDPERSLNPTMRIGTQITEAIRCHLPLGRAEAHERAVELLRMVRLPTPERRFYEYPHQLSGGVLASVRKGRRPVTATPIGARTTGADATAGTAGSDALLEVRHLVQEFVLRDYGGVKGGVLQAVSDVSFDLHAGETLGIVGETGAGKSTLARSVIQAPPPKHGQVIFEGQDLARLPNRAMKSVRRDMQMVFQDPFRSLDPKWTVSRIVTEPLIAYGIGSRAERRERVRSMLDLVGLDAASYGGRHPRELSGGQAQRVAIARALVLKPKLILCDEPVSSLDVLVQAQVLNMFEKLRADLGLSYLFIAHDLALVKQVSDRVAVMYLGRLCEIGPVRDIYPSRCIPTRWRC